MTGMVFHSRGGTMEKIYRHSLIVSGIIVIIMAASPVSAVPVLFSSSAEVGGHLATGSAVLDHVIQGNTLIIALENTSPITDSGGNSNSPAITGIGFDTANEVDASLVSLSAYALIPGSGFGSETLITGHWELDDTANLQGGNGGSVLEFVAQTTNGVRFGLVNPLALVATGSNLFETTAVLAILFDGNPGDIFNWYLRFQNLGQDGTGSLNNVAAAPVPEPATIFMLSAGLLGAAVLRKKKP